MACFFIFGGGIVIYARKSSLTCETGLRKPHLKWSWEAAGGALIPPHPLPLTELQTQQEERHLHPCRERPILLLYRRKEGFLLPSNKFSQ